MRAQFAPLEIAISGFLIFSVLSYAYVSIGRSMANAHAAKEELLGSAAMYDFISQAVHNSTLHSCLVAYLANDSGCMDSYLRYYRYIYGINLSLYAPESQAPAGMQRFRCFPYLVSGVMHDFCMGV